MQPWEFEAVGMSGDVKSFSVVPEVALTALGLTPDGENIIAGGGGDCFYTKRSWPIVFAMKDNEREACDVFFRE